MPVGDVEKLVHGLQDRLAEFAHASRLNLMDEMAAGLAHELNQPLTAIALLTSGCARRIRSGVWDAADLLEAMEQACLQADRAGRIINFLRGLAHKGEPKAAAACVNDIVRQAAGFMCAEARQKRIVVRFELADHLPSVCVDGIQIELVVLNLVRNALEAMDDAEVVKHELGIRTETAGGDGVEVAIRDTGKGLPVESLDQVFDAFFTTKTDGLGMGLSISRSIVEAHGGRLWAVPNRDHGVTFRFTLPTAKRGVCDAV